MSRLVIVSVKMPETYLEAIDKLVELGRYTSRSDAIRAAVRELIEKELLLTNSFRKSPKKAVVVSHGADI